ncbi:sulfate permease SutB [Fusarium oxysporum f. sp. lycopersici 4287]|uniref:Sulfate permease SutB n=1 Tax=Fusarium oxysporum f. sp. lycopersici (strain 4287 / CBS 123668 / FGSC 9935 / NRRL 34936) TaxID=426428 RepID=A0A0J9UMC5_FUSO4|nr:sulfate permease SutB [Fusarium oxysporum f. sp. lycopersici 4287]KNB00629.1 sulfate permease SutB [Fusarium oxysporum f. sp. lycopersici 4287]
MSQPGKNSAKTALEKFIGADHTEPEEKAPSISNADLYIEEEPTVGEFLREITPSARAVGEYFYNLFPFLSWVGKYNLIWFIGDLVAGITVGAVVVPQSMAYAQLAQLPVEYGLYSSFMGVLIYWFFATSKDITIGPVAVMSQVTGNIVLKAADSLPDVPGHVVASALAVIVGSIVTFLGLARLGWLVEFIPLPSICAFMTGSGVNIIAGQVPKLMGIKGVNTRQATYRVIIDTLKNLGGSKLDAAIGLSALTMLYLIRIFCSTMAKKQPQRAKLYFFISTLRTAFVILLYVGISAGMNINHRSKPRISIVGDVPSGFTHAAVPEINTPIIKSFVSELPAAVIVVLIEHISISKSFGRVNNYVIDPSQELVAIGVSNLLGPFLGAYPATGSFSRTAIKSKAGVRTPFAGVITAIVVLLALYALTAVFFYIPNAGLAGVIIHAVGDVITPPKVVYQFWRVSPIEVIIFFAGVLVTIFSSIENGIYTTIAMSAAVVVFRLFKTRGRFLGVVRVRTMKANVSDGTSSPGSVDEGEGSLRAGFLPLDHGNGANPKVVTIFKECRRTNPALLGKLGDRPWNDREPRHIKAVENDERPILKAVVLDFSSVNNVDVTSIQALIDVRNQLDKFAAPEVVDWHFANIENRWTKRALAAAGFGFRTPRTNHDGTGQWKAIFSIADLGGDDSAATAAALDEKAKSAPVKQDIEAVDDSINSIGSEKGVSRDPTSARLIAVQGLNRPFFHLDLQEAVDAAVSAAELKQH